MNITSRVAELSDSNTKDIILNNKEIQFYHDGESYKWVDTRFERSKYIDYNSKTKDMDSLLKIFKNHLNDVDI